MTPSPKPTEIPADSDDENIEYVGVISGTIEESVLTSEVKNAIGCNTVDELIAYMQESIITNASAGKILSGISVDNTQVIDVTIYVILPDGTREKVTALNFPEEGIDVLIPYPAETDKDNYDFIIGHLITMGCNGQTVGTMEYLSPEKTVDGLKVHIYSASPFVIGWKEKAQDESGSPESNIDDDVDMLSPKTDSIGGDGGTDNSGKASLAGWLVVVLVTVLVCLAGAVGWLYLKRKKDAEE